MTRDNQPLYVSKSTRRDYANAAVFGMWFVTAVAAIIHEVVNHG